MAASQAFDSPSLQRCKGGVEGTSMMVESMVESIVGLEGV